MSMSGYGIRVGARAIRLIRHRTRTLLATTAALDVLAVAAGMVALFAAGLTLIATVLHPAAGSTALASHSRR